MVPSVKIGMSGIGARIVFYPTLLYNIILEKITSRAWYSRIDNTVLVGALPFKSMNKELVENVGVRGVVSLNEEYELRNLVNTEQEWKELGVNSLYLSTVDFVAAPSQVKIPSYGCGSQLFIRAILK